MASNTLTLKVNVTYDQTKALAEAKKLQSTYDKSYQDAQAKNKTATKKTNTELGKQNTLFGKLTASVKKNIKQMVSMGIAVAILGAITLSIKQAITLMFSLDKAFTNFAIVSKATATELAFVNTQIEDMSLGLGILKKDVIDSVTEFSRAGFSISESMTLAKNAIMAANVGMTELSQVTTFIIAGLKSFQFEAEESARILDVLFRVSNTTAINMEGIGEAFLRSANTLATAGATLEEAAALIASANESIQDPAKVGTALKTIASRLRGIDDATGDAIPSLAADFKQVGIEIQNADGSFRDIYDVFKDFADIYDDLDELTKESLLEKLAGKRQKNILIGLLSNFDVAEQALNDALNSTGEVAEANEKYLDSLEAKTTQLKEAWNQLLTAFSNTTVLKAVVDGIKLFVIGLTGVVENLPLAIGLTTAWGIALFGLNPIFGTIAIVLGVVSQAYKLFGDQTGKAIEKLNKYNTEIDRLNGQIANLKGLKDRSDRETELLAIYEKQLAAKQKLADIEEGKILTARLKESEATVSNILKKNQDILDILNEYPEQASGVSEETLSEIKEYETELLRVQIQAQETMLAVSEGSDEFKKAEKEYNLATDALVPIYEAQRLLGIYTEDTTEIITDQTDALTKHEQLLAELSDTLDFTTGKYELLSDALLELEENGYLATDTLAAITAEFPGVVAATGLAKDAFADYVDADKKGRIAIIEGLKEQLNAEITTAEKIIKIFSAVAKVKGLSFFTNPLVEKAELAIENARNGIILLDNDIAALNATETNRNKTIADNNSSTETEISLLTDLELALKNVNYQIDTQDKIIARTTGIDDQIEANKILIDLYKEKGDLLLEQQRLNDLEGKGLTIADEGFEDYIDSSYELSLAIEDNANSIYGLIDANNDLSKSLLDSSVEERESNLLTLTEKLNDEIQKQIDLEDEAYKKSSEAIAAKITAKEAELAALKETNDALEDQVALEGLLADLQDLRTEKQNILNNKNTEIIKDAEIGFEKIADPEEVERINEEIADAEEAILDLRNDQAQAAAEQKIEDEITALEKTATLEEAAYNKRVGELESFQDEVSLKIENGDEITIASLQTLGQTLEETEGVSYTNRLSNLDGFISEYNAKVATLNSQKEEVKKLEATIKSTQEAIERTQSTTSSSIIGSTTGSGVVANKASIGNTTTTNNSDEISIGTMNVETKGETELKQIISGATSLIKAMTK